MFYEGICSERGKTVPEEKAFEYALRRVSSMKGTDKQEFIEWFYSGNWVKVKYEPEMD